MASQMFAKGIQALTNGAADWDTELVVVRGENREHLLERVQSLCTFVADDSVSLRDLAFTLNSQLAPGGSRLAMVAGSVGGLRSRLDRALHNARCAVCSSPVAGP